jgi:peptidoglycan/xylan/chitin deacetylase (PgdA/CDA1 family)
MYHVLSTPPAEARYPALWVSPAAFRSHVRALAAAGYEGVTLTEVFAAWRRGIKLPRKPVVLTFDDGYRSDATVAGPVLASRGWPGVLNLEIHNATPAGISRARLRRLVRAGWEIASHTMSHPDLTTLGPRRLREEVVRSRAWIRRRLGGPAAFFCYPAGRFNAAVIAAVRAAGYRGATTEIPGVASARDDPFRLPRVRVAAGEPARDLLAALR